MSPDTLSGRRVAILAADGVEEVELTAPRDAILEAGGEVRLLSLDNVELRAFSGDVDEAGRHPVDGVVSNAREEDYDALVLPGGVINPDLLRRDEDAIGFIRDFAATGRPVAAICHAPWTLIDAGIAEGRRLTAFPTVRPDLRNAGAEVVDEEVVVDGSLITSRNPDDLPAFCEAVVRAVAGAERRETATAGT